jgi:cytochrome P450
VFDPERFSEKNKKSREQVAHIPFGAGPRNCIAMRFAILEMKILLSVILSKYKFIKCDETEVRLNLMI